MLAAHGFSSQPASLADRQFYFPPAKALTQLIYPGKAEKKADFGH
jgi:hypothetical protein